MELYIHIPFCVRKCAYCDFLSFPQTKEVMQQYVEKLIEEIRWAGKQYPDRAISSIFIGGGTPSILDAEQMTAIMHAVREAFYIEETAEISIEANPGTVTEEKLRAYRDAGINRISFGLQSAELKELKLLGMIHTYEEFLESDQMARILRSDTLMDMIRHDGFSQQRRIRLCNSQCKRVETTDMVLLVPTINFLSCRQTYMVRLLHMKSFSVKF